ncbi:MAG: hypothetical protein FD153_1105 [Rhodospirillaceae bacterium]|nr:MAG: hypothetical protein FD153_1105 [Rhodospirillaceae bacterium]
MDDVFLTVIQFDGGFKAVTRLLVRLNEFHA